MAVEHQRAVRVAGEIDLFTVNQFRIAIAGGFADLRDSEFWWLTWLR
jgi:hypothetical protein